MHRTTVVATMGAAAAALLALAAPATAATKPAAAAAEPRPYDTTFPVPAKVLPGGIAPGTPREDWDLCDGPGSLYQDSGANPVRSPLWYTMLVSPLKVLQDNYAYAPRWGTANPNQPWPAYVTCTATGPVTVPSGHTPVRLSVTITDISNQAVRVAYVTAPGAVMGPRVNYPTWAHAHWALLHPSESTVFTTPSFTISNDRYSQIFEGYWLIRPTAPPPLPPATDPVKNPWPNFTEWVNAFAYLSAPFLDASRPTSQCSSTLVPGTVSGIASAPSGGYWVLSSTGQASGCGATPYGNLNDGLSTVGGLQTDRPPAVIASFPGAGNGYWLLSGGGQVLPFGHARFRGQYSAAAGIAINGTGPTASVNPADILTFTSMAATPNGKGYWLANAYGHVFAYHAPYYGSADFSRAVGVFPTNYLTLPAAAAAGIAPTDGSKGYVIVAKDGVVARFGKAPTCSLPAGASVAGVAPDYRTGGYWAATTDGHVYACQAPNWPYKAVAGSVTGIAALGNGLGYRLVTSNGKVYDYGAAVWHGDPN